MAAWESPRIEFGAFRINVNVSAGSADVHVQPPGSGVWSGAKALGPVGRSDTWWEDGVVSVSNFRHPFVAGNGKTYMFAVEDGHARFGVAEMSEDGPRFVGESTDATPIEALDLGPQTRNIQYVALDGTSLSAPAPGGAGDSGVGR